MSDRLPDVGSFMPLAATLGIEITEVDGAIVRGRMPWRQELCTTFGVLHGGALMTFGDTLCATCAGLNLPDGAGTTTIESKTNFFRPVTEGHVDGVAEAIHIGRRTIVLTCEIARADGKRAAYVLQTQAVLTS